MLQCFAVACKLGGSAWSCCRHCRGSPCGCPASHAIPPKSERYQRYRCKRPACERLPNHEQRTCHTLFSNVARPIFSVTRIRRRGTSLPWWGDSPTDRPNLRGHLAETRIATSCARVVVYPADSIYTRYTRFGKTGEPSGGRMSVPSKVQLMNE